MAIYLILSIVAKRLANLLFSIKPLDQTKENANEIPSDGLIQLAKDLVHLCFFQSALVYVFDIIGILYTRTQSAACQSLKLEQSATPFHPSYRNIAVKI